MKKVKLSVAAAFIAVFAVIAAAIPLLFGGATASADTQGTYLSGYDVTYDIASDRSIAVTEDITVNFAGNRALLRDIPVNGGELIRNVGVYEIKDGKTTSVEYSVYSESSDFLTVDIGGNSVKTGERTYRLTYDYCLTKAQEGDDALALTPIGAGWGVDIYNVTFKLILPKGYKENSAVCFIDATDGTQSAISFAASTSENGRTVITGEVDHLYANSSKTANDAIRVDLGFENGVLSTYFDFTPYIFVIVAVVLLAIMFAVRMLFFNKDILTPVVNFEAPSKMDPLMMGKLIDNKVNDEDISSMIFYWADKGYLKINLDDGDDPTLIRVVQNLPDGCADYEKTMFKNLFAIGDAVKPSQLKFRFYGTVQNVTSKVNASTKSLFDSKSISISILFALLATVVLGLTPFAIGYLFIDGSYYFYYPLLVIVPALVIYSLSELAYYNKNKFSGKKKLMYPLLAVAIGAVATLLYVIFVPSYFMGWLPKLLLCVVSFAGVGLSVSIISRTKGYTEQLNEIVGFRNFIQLAEKDRLEMLLEEDPQFYYHILPYAQVLGVSEKWEEKFADITVAPPAWATSSTLNTVVEFHIMNTMIRNSMVRMGSNMVSRPSSAGKSGGSHGSFGGFSGGGHGGGGGRFR